MRAVWYDRQGAAAEVLTCGELAIPHAGHNEVRVRLEASGVANLRFLAEAFSQRPHHQRAFIRLSLGGAGRQRLRRAISVRRRFRIPRIRI